MIEKLMSAIGAVVIVSGLFFAAVTNKCDSNGEFKSPWWSGKERVYICKEKKND